MDLTTTISNNDVDNEPNFVVVVLEEGDILFILSWVVVEKESLSCR